MMSNELFNLTSEDGFLTIEFHKNEIEFEKDISFFDRLSNVLEVSVSFVAKPRLVHAL